MLDNRNFFFFEAKYCNEYVHDEFIKNSFAGICYNFEEAPELYYLMSAIKKNDIIILKAFAPSSNVMTVFAIGVCKNPEIHPAVDSEGSDISYKLGFGITVDWRVVETITIPKNLFKDKLYNWRISPIYQEFNPRINKIILNLLFKKYFYK